MGLDSIEMPPDGTEHLSFLHGGGEDTPSRWLTFSGTPGNTTPGTAFGSPFWASLSTANRQGSPSLGTSGGGGGGHGGAGAGAGTGKSYSPSKELNPFEISFFPSSNSGVDSAGAGTEKAKNAGQIKQEEEEEDEDDNDANESSERGGLSSSLKRPFEDATNHSEQGSTTHPHSNTSTTNGLPDGPLPAWKRPKYNASSQHPSTSSSSGADGSSSTSHIPYGSSPAMMGGSNPSPDSGSPASSVLPTPSLQSAVLPLGPGGELGHARKPSLPPDQLEASKLAIQNNLAPLHSMHQHQVGGSSGPSPPNSTGIYNNNTVHGLPGFPGHGGPIVQRVPNPMPSAYPSGMHQHQQQPQPHSAAFHQSYPAHMHPHQHQQGYHPFSGQHQQQAHTHAAPQPVILPPRHMAPQRTGSPSSAATPTTAGSYAQRGEDQYSYPNQPQQGQQTLHAIPYANGRAPSAQPGSNNNTAATSGVNANTNNSGGGSAAGSSRQRKAKGKAVAALAEDDGMEEDELDGPGNASTSSVPGDGNGNGNGNGAGGRKKGGKRNNSTAGSSASSHSQHSQLANSNNSNNNKKEDGKKKVAIAAPSPQQDIKADESEVLGDDEEEEKRKAFLERNRQAACRSRQKKKEWIGNLENHAASLQAHNAALSQEVEALRKEMFALRHTLSFHERCGCPSIQEWVGKNGPLPAGGMPPQSTMPQQQQQQQQQQQPHGNPPPPAGIPPLHASALPAHQQAQPLQQQAPMPPQPPHFQPQPQPVQPPPAPLAHPVPAPAPAAALNAIPLMNAASPQNVVPGPPVIPQSATQTLAPIPTRPNSLNIGSAGNGNNSALSRHLDMQNINNANSAAQGAELARPGSAGPTYGLSTPNFADLFGGFMNKVNGFSTPGGGNGGFAFSPALPNTFGLSATDIPVRPASAPPTPSPALDPRLSAPGVDYFSSKGEAHAPSSFGDLFAGNLRGSLASMGHSVMA